MTMRTTIPTPEPNFGHPTQSLAAVIPDQHDTDLAKVSSHALGPVIAAAGDVSLTIANAEALRLLLSVLSEMARGNAVSLIPLHAEMSTQEAADILNVSRPYVVGLLEKGAIPFRKVGVQRRVLFSDLMDYKARCDSDRRMALDGLARQAQDLRLGYDV
jgi:excisionase family DNA binding protein